MALGRSQVIGGNNGGGATTLTLDPTTTPTEGQLVLVAVTVRGGSGTTIKWNVAFQPIPTNPVVDSTTVLRQAIYWRIAGGSEPGTYVATFSSSQKASGACVVLDGADLTSPIDVSKGQANASSSTITAPGVTVVASNCWLFGFFGTASGETISTYTSPLAEQTDSASTGGSASSRTTTALADSNGTVSTGATGDKTAVATGTAVNIGHLVAIKPQVATGSTFNASVAASSDDGRAQSQGHSVVITGTIVELGNFSGSASADGFRFTGVTVPKNATINYAYLKLRPQATYTAAAASVIEVNASCHAADNAATLTTTGTNLDTTARPRSTAKTNDWRLHDVLVDVDEIIPITSAVQEIVNRAGWASGNALMVITDDSGSTSAEWQDFYAWDHSTGAAPAIVINYSVSAIDRTATPVTAAIATTENRTATPVTAALQVTTTRTATTVTAALQTTETRTATPVSVALQTTETRTATPVTAALQVTTTRTAGSVTAALQATVDRTATPVTAALQVVNTRTATPVTASISTDAGTLERTAGSVTAAIQVTNIRTATPVTAAVQTIEQRTSTPVTVAITTTLVRTATPVTAALQATETRTATSITVALQTTQSRTATPVTAALSTTNPRTATPITVAISTPVNRTATPVTAAVQTTNTRTASSITTALQVTSTRTATPVTASITTPGNHQVSAGSGYSDVSGKQLVRTGAGDRVYLASSDCSSYPCDSTAQTLRIYKANSAGLPTAFTRQDQSDEPPSVAGWSAAIDGSDVIHLAWTYRTANGATLAGIRYTTFNTATDQFSGVTETIVSGGLTDGVGQGVQTISLALDANGVPHIAYLSGNGSARRVLYRNRVGGSWSSATTLDTGVTYSGNQRAWHPNLAFDTTGRIVAAWLRGSFNGDNDGSIFTRIRQTNGSWDTLVNVSGSNLARTTIDQSTSMLVTRNNRYHIAYLQQPDDYIRYAYSDDAGASWTHNNPGSGTQVTHNPSLGPGAAGGVRIYGHGAPDNPPDGHGDDLFYFESTGGAGTWSAWTSYTTGTFDSSVNTRWSQYWFNHPATLDIMYWDDSYPNNLYYGADQVAGEIVTRTATPVTAAISTTNPRTASSITASIVVSGALDRFVTPVTVAIQVTTNRTLTPVTAALSTTIARTTTPVTAIIAVTGVRTATPITAAVQATQTRTATPVTVALQVTNLRTAGPITAVIQIGGTRFASPITVAIQAHVDRLATPVTVAIRVVNTRTAGSITASISTPGIGSVSIVALGIGQDDCLTLSTRRASMVAMQTAPLAS